MSRATEELLADLHGKVAKRLLEKIENETATPAEMALAVKMLKDNNITVVPETGSLLDDIADKFKGLPEHTDPESAYS